MPQCAGPRPSARARATCAPHTKGRTHPVCEAGGREPRNKARHG
jgi:hypothetical protein